MDESLSDLPLFNQPVVQPHLPHAHRRAAYADAIAQRPAQERRVYHLLRAAGPTGLTCDQIEEQTGGKIQFSTAGATIISLRHGGWVAPIGKRKTRHQKNATVYIALDIPDPSVVPMPRPSRWERAVRDGLSLLERGHLSEAKRVLALAITEGS